MIEIKSQKMRTNHGSATSNIYLHNIDPAMLNDNLVDGERQEFTWGEVILELLNSKLSWY